MPLLGAEPKLAEALAGYLRTVGTAARTGVIPGLNERDPELVERIAGVLPRVAEVTSRIRTLGRDLHSFRRDLMTATPRSVATTAFTIACVAIYAAMVLSGVEPIIPTTEHLRAWGANDGARVVLRHEYWRLPASVFIHGGLIHLAVNMWCLYSIGPLVERLFGNLAFAAIYLAAGIGGAIASMATLPFRVSVGASGAIFGILGALLAFLIVHRRSVPGSVLKPLRSSALSFVIFNTLFGAAVPNIDQSAHMGGLATGFVGGLLLIRPWPVVRSLGTTLRRLALGAALAGALLGIGVAAVRLRERTLPPGAAYEDFSDQLAASVKEFNAISKDMIATTGSGMPPRTPRSGTVSWPIPRPPDPGEGESRPAESRDHARSRPQPHATDPRRWPGQPGRRALVRARVPGDARPGPSDGTSGRRRRPDGDEPLHPRVREAADRLSPGTRAAEVLSELPEERVQAP